MFVKKQNVILIINTQCVFSLFVLHNNTQMVNTKSIPNHLSLIINYDNKEYPVHRVFFFVVSYIFRVIIVMICISYYYC